MPKNLMICLSRSSLFLLFIISFIGSNAQSNFIGIGSEWDDQLDEWVVLYDEEEEGIIERTWKIGDDWSEWSYDVGEYSGRIKQKWDNQPWFWELRTTEGQIITFEVKWRGDITEWEIKYNGKRYKYHMPDRNDYGYWLLDNKNLGYWECTTVNFGDIRDWETYDELNEEVDFEFKIVLSFISLASNLFS